MRYILIVQILLVSWATNAQTIINGKLHNKTLIPRGVSVLAHIKGNKNAIIAFCISDKQGSFTIKINNKIDSVSITASSLTFSDETIYIANSSQYVDLNLKSEQHNIDEILVRGDPILFKRDTLIYNIAQFAKNNDRSIGDVLSKMPGFELASNGKISYQGKEIEKYYIEGLDLLEGRYGIANKSLSHTSVRTVEVMKNHQSIKMLEGKVFSNKTSINIRLKRGISIAGAAQLSLGYKPLLWETNITPMLFSKKQQGVVSYQANNTGNDVSEQLEVHYLNQMKTEKKDELCNISYLMKPKIKKARYHNNNIHMLSYNHLAKLANKSTIKINTSYINDYRKEEGLSKSTFFLSKDTITSTEEVNNKYFVSIFKSDLIYENNSNTKFLRNKTSFIKHSDSNRSSLHINKMPSQINNTSPYTFVGNNFKYIIPIKGNYLNIVSDISYDYTSQKLKVSPNFFGRIFSIHDSNKTIQQNVGLKDFNTHNYISFSNDIKRLNLKTKLFIDYENKNLSSDIFFNQKKYENKEFENNISWQHLSTGISEAFTYKNRDFNACLEIPINNIYYRIEDKNGKKIEHINKVNISPSLSIDYRLTPMISTNLSSSYKERYANILDINYGYIMNRYNSLSKKNNLLRNSKSYNISTHITYENPISNWFISMLAFKTFTKRNTLLAYKINTNGSREINSILCDNKIESTNILFSSSKFLSDISSTIYFDTRYMKSGSEIIKNEKLQKLNNTSIMFEPRFSFAMFNFFYMMFTYQYAIAKQKIINDSMSIYDSNIFVNLNMITFQGQSLGVDLEYYSNKTDNTIHRNYFANLNYKIKPNNSKIELEFKCNNLLNSKEIKSFIQSDISRIENTYLLREREFIASIKFNIAGKNK